MTPGYWEAQRREFPTLDTITYLNSCSLGLLSRRSRKAVGRFLELWTDHGAAAWYDHWLSEVAALRRGFARLACCQEGEVALVPSISAGLAAISSSLDFSKRNRVVTTGLDFPTVPHHFLALARRGVETVIVPSRDQVTVDMGLLAEAINNNTALVATSRVFFTSGYVQDVAHLADLCHRRGALLLVDDYQATGQLPLDVTATGVDVLLTGGLKWLLGGPGIAYMYVKEEHVREFNPTATGWFAHRDQFDFNPTAMVFKDDARRFEAGTPAVAAVYAGKAGLSLVSELGPHAIRQRTTELTQDLVGQLREGGFNLRIPPRPDLHASITMVEATNPQGIVAELRNRAIVVDARPGGVRISPYFYNNSDDNRHLVGALEEVRQEFPGWFGTRAPV